jgi:NAD(P)-dependent dehydrogenase (short-subunit alcohol dehydrogenase family)
MKRVAVITGVLGGIGSAAAKVFNEAGWIVVGVDRQECSALSWVSHFIKADVAGPEIPIQIIREISANEGRIDALINNAAVQICKPLLETSLEEWEITMASNVRSVYLLTKAAHSFLRESRGAIVNVSSVHASATSKGMAAYATSKGALSALTRAIAIELAADGIRANSIAPGAVDTGMLRKGLTRGHTAGIDLEDMVNKIGLKHPLRRVAQPEEIGRSIFFLADNNQSSFITGQTLIVDGGALAQLSTE